MKKYIITLNIICFILLSTCTVVYADIPDPPSILGETCILIDVETGKILYEQDAYKPMAPASTTKIMTAILALEKGDLEDIVTISDIPPAVTGSSIYLSEGEKLTLEEILYGMLLDSGNDAATAVAEHIGEGSISLFINMMNDKATEIGARDTNYVNPTGLTDEGHMTTAYDLALISRYALLNFPKFREIVSTKTVEIPWHGMNTTRKLENTNRLLWSYDGADGVKTGFTSQAGRTLVATATKDGWQLMAVVLKSGWDEVFQDATILLDYGFDTFERVGLLKEGEVVTTRQIRFGKKDIEIVANEDFSAILPKNSSITREISIDENLKAPILKGTVLGELDLLHGDEKIATIDLIAKEDVERKIYTYWWFWFPILLFFLCLYIKRYTNQRLDTTI